MTVSQQATDCTGEEQPKRRPYQAPQLASVDLEADEVLATGCKTAEQFASGTLVCWNNNCSGFGS
jgi:hypothetical protein